jgi:hypothetical protein
MRKIFHTFIKPIIVISIVLKISVAVGILFDAIVSLFYSIITESTFIELFRSKGMIGLSTAVAIITIIWSLIEIVYTTANKK